MVENSFHIQSVVLYVTAILVSAGLSKKLLRSGGGGYRPSLIKCFVVAFPMALVVGFRSSSVGYDTIRYIENSYRLLANLPATEFLFTGLVKLTHWICGGQSYTLMLTSFAFISIVTPIYAVTRLEDEHDNTMFVFLFGLVFFLCTTDQFRQMIAVGFVALAVVYCQQNRYVACIVSTILGFGFHNTAILGMLMYVFCRIVTSTKTTTLIIKAGQVRLLYLKTSLLQVFTIIIGIVVTVFLFNNLDLLKHLLATFLPSYTKYLDRYLNISEIGMGWILDLMVMMPLLFMGRDMKNNKERACYLFALTAIPIRFFGYLSYFISRMMYFPQLVMLLLYSKLMVRERDYAGIRHSRKEYMLYAFSIAFFIIKYVMRNEHGAFPYVFWWNA